MRIRLLVHADGRVLLSEQQFVPVTRRTHAPPKALLLWCMHVVYGCVRVQCGTRAQMKTNDFISTTIRALGFPPTQRVGPWAKLEQPKSGVSSAHGLVDTSRHDLWTL